MDFFIQQTLNGIVLGSVFALIALGFSLVLANLRVFHVAHEGVFVWGAIVAWYVTARIGLSLWIAFPIAFIFAGLMNVAAYFGLIRHLQARRDRELAGFISSLGGLIILVEGAAIILNRGSVRLPFDAFPITVWSVAGVQISSIQLLMVGVAVLALALLWWLVEGTELGREIAAVAYDRELAALLGVNVDRISSVVFFISGAFGGLAAVLVAIAFNVVDSQMGASYLVLAIAVTVIGGFGSVKGAFVGGLLVGLASAYTTGYLTSSFRQVVVFGMLIAFLVVRPTGLFYVAEAGDRA